MKSTANHGYDGIILLALLSLIASFIFVPYLTGKTAFILGWDMRQLYSSNFEALRTMLKSALQTRTMPYWSWVSFLGNDYYSSKLFYFQDVFDYPFALTNLSYTSVIMIQTYLKFLVAGFAFYYYSGYQDWSRRTRILGSLVFAFSAFNLQTMMHPFFGSFFVFLPLYFLGIDRYLHEHRTGLFTFMVFFLFVNNYYLFYSVSIFSILYFLWRYKKEHNSYRGWLKEALHLIVWYLTGFLLSGIVVIPEVMAILANSRVGQRSSILLFHSIQPYLEYLSGIFTPTSALANRDTAIASVYSYTSTNDSVMAVFLWATSICTLLFPQLFCRTNPEHRKNSLFLIAISAIALVPILSSIMHGFSEPSFRWLASPSFLLIISVLPYLDHPERINPSLLKKTAIAAPFLLLSYAPLTAVLTGKQLASVMSEYWLILLFVPTLTLTGWAMIRRKQQIMIISTVIELCLVSFFSFYGNPAFTKVTKQSAERSTQILGAKDEYNQYLLKENPVNSSQFYRNYIQKDTVYWQESINYNLNFNIMGVLSYDSTYHSSANDLKKLADIESYLPWTFDIENPDILNLVSVKYALVTAEEQVPFKNYRYVDDYYSMKIYENLDYINLGKTYTTLMTYDQYQGNDTSIVTTSIICHKDDEDAIRNYLGTEEVQCSTAKAGSNSLYADITTKEKGFAVLSVPYDKGWTVFLNGEKVTTYEVNGGLTGVPVPSGYSEIYMYYQPYGLKYGAICNCAGILLYIIIVIFKKRSRIACTNIR